MCVEVGEKVNDPMFSHDRTSPVARLRSSTRRGGVVGGCGTASTWLRRGCAPGAGGVAGVSSGGVTGGVAGGVAGASPGVVAPAAPAPRPRPRGASGVIW